VRQLKEAFCRETKSFTLAGPDECVTRAYAVTPASAAAARAPGVVDVVQLPTAAKPPQAGLLSGSHLAFGVCGLVLAPELAVDAVQAIPYVARLLLAFLALCDEQDAITHWPTSSTPWPGTMDCPAAGLLCLASNMHHILCCLLLASLITSNICVKLLGG